MKTQEAALIFAERYTRALILTGIAWIALYAWLVSP
jgi:putative Ca2+/H+ antiporter (TMEM165/GDT1 family)